MIEKDLEVLQSAGNTIDSLEQKYEMNLNLDYRINVFNSPGEVVRETNQIKNAEKRMVTRIKKIAVLNDLEKTKVEGLKGKLEFIFHYLTLETNFEKATEIYLNISESINSSYNSLGNIKYVFMPILMSQVFVNIVITAAYIPIALGIIAAITGCKGIQLLTYIGENKALKNKLEQAGLYEKIVEFIKKQKFSLDDYGDSYMQHLKEETYKDFVNEEFDYKRR